VAKANASPDALRENPSGSSERNWWTSWQESISSRVAKLAKSTTDPYGGFLILAGFASLQALRENPFNLA
jgi:hypothetical protein